MLQAHTSAASLSDCWDTLLGNDFAFLKNGFLTALEESGATSRENGWQPFHHSLQAEDGSVLGILPLFLKSHSHGEFTFDWGYAQAYEQAGGQYYPKLYCGAPFTPATGPRFLAKSAETRRQLVAGLRRLCWQHGLSSAHVAYPLQADAAPLRNEGFLQRTDWQYHWHNADYPDFEAFLAALKPRKRKNIRQERRRVASAGFSFRRIHGHDATREELEFATRMYENTFDKKGNWAALGSSFFARCAHHVPRNLLFIFAYQHEEPVACAIFFVSDKTLYGRYWGCAKNEPLLHFETCFYQGIELAIELKLSTFEPGAQGVHKIARGFLPTRVSTWHYFRDPGMQDAVARHLSRSEAALQAHEDELQLMNPYR